MTMSTAKFVFLAGLASLTAASPAILGRADKPARVHLYTTDDCGGTATVVQIEINKCYNSEATALKKPLHAIEGFLNNNNVKGALCETKAYPSADCTGNLGLTDNNEEDTCLIMYTRPEDIAPGVPGLFPEREAKSFMIKCCASTDPDSGTCDKVPV